MVRRFVVLLVAAVGVVGFAPPALAAPPLTVAYQDLCGFVEVTLANTTGADVAYVLHRTGMPSMPGTVPANGTATRQEAVNDGSDVSVSTGAPTHVHHAPPGCVPPLLTATIRADCDSQVDVFIHSQHAAATGVSVEVAGALALNGATIAKDTTRTVEAVGPAPPFDVRVLRTTPGGSASVIEALTYANPAGCGPGSLKLTFTDLCGGFTVYFTSSASAFQHVSIVRGSTVVKAFLVGPLGPVLASVQAADGEAFTVVQGLNTAVGPVAGAHVYAAPAGCGPGPNVVKSFVDSCTGTAYTVTNADHVPRTFVGLRDGTEMASLALNAGGSGTLVVPGTAAATVSLTADGKPVESHAFPGCPAAGGGLPVTGARTALAALVLLAGGLLLALARRRRLRFRA